MLVFGLTGPSGAGKSTVAELFRSHGVPVLNADEIYHRLLIPPSQCLNELTDTFGRQILAPDGTLNRSALAEIVFEDHGELERLNKIAHAHVLREAQRQLRVLRDSGHAAAVFDAPQLFESGANRSCNAVISVLAEPNIRLHRILLRDGISPEAAIKRMEAQKPDTFFRSHSDYIIENNSNPENLIPQVRRILAETGVCEA